MRLRNALSTCALLPMLMSAPGMAASTSRSVGKESVAGTPTVPAVASTGALSPAEMAAARAAVLRMINEIDLSYQEFTLPNGLRVLVHTDRRSPTVHVGMWYDVGSKHETPGRSGFAHLFEHLMFNGSENVPGDYLGYLMSVGATVNGSTSSDRTNYYEQVPTQALDRALFMESDRMGHMLGGISQHTLDEQRGVVQNEKRQGADSPTAVVEDMQTAAIYPKPHPYDHSVIGSMKDLNTADLDDVRHFFKQHYGPNNALLILIGDVDLETAKRLVTTYFGDIPAGPRNVRPSGGPVMLTKIVRQATTAPISVPIIRRVWPVPGAGNHDALILDAVSETMAGSADSPLQKHLVREQKLFQSLKIGNNTATQAGEFTISGQLRSGIDPKVAIAALDREIALYLEQLPSAELLTRWVASYSFGIVRSLEYPSARGSLMGERALADGDPAAIKRDLRFYARLTPAEVSEAARKWLTRPYWELTVTPGPRVTQKDDAGMDGSLATAQAPIATNPAPLPSGAAATKSSRGPLPAVGAPRDPRFPSVEKATLANGIPILYARSGSTPFTQMNLRIEGGARNESDDQAGTMAMMYSLLSRGFAGMDEARIRERRDLTGITLLGGANNEHGGITLDTPDANLGPALHMAKQLLTQPTFPADVIERMKREARDRRASSRLDTRLLINQELLPLIDAASPYNRDVLYGDGKSYQRITRESIVAAYHRWLRPEHASLTIVSDKPLAELLPALNRTIGTWKATGAAVPVPPVDYKPRPGTPQIVLIDQPGAVQATIASGQWVPMASGEPNEALQLASAVLAQGFLSRVNMNLREDKHWSYGASGFFNLRPFSSAYGFFTEVQQDKTGPAIAEVVKEARSIISDRPITQEEFEREKRTALGELASAYSDRGSVMTKLEDMYEHDRPASYPGQIAERVRAVTLADADAALRGQIDPAKWSWVIAGNAAIIRPQLSGLGLPVTVIKATDVLPPL